MLRTVKLYGHLGAKYGKLFKFQAASIRGAVSLLQANFPEFREDILNFKGIGYKVFVGNTQVDASEIYNPLPDSDEIRIVPVVAGSGGGSGGGLLKIVAGAALIYFSGGLAAAAGLGATATATLSSIFVSIGVGLVMTGIAELLYQPPPQQKNSTSFGGIVNTTKQGECVPLGYGRRVCGAAVISAGISTALI